MHVFSVWAFQILDARTFHPPATFLGVESVCELKFFHPVAIERRLCFAARHLVVVFVGAIHKLLNKYRDLLFKNRMENRAS